MSPAEINDRAAALRTAFDATFASAAASRTEKTADFLALRVGGSPYAIRLLHIDGIVAGRPIVPVPSNNPYCLGIAGIRGTPVPVFSLAAIVGDSQREPDPRWLVLSGREEPVAFAFAALDGYLRLPRAQGTETQPPRAASGAVEIIRTATDVRPVINIPHYVSVLRARTTQNGQEQ